MDNLSRMFPSCVDIQVRISVYQMNFAKPFSVFIIHQVHWDKLFSKLYYIISSAVVSFSGLSTTQF